MDFPILIIWMGPLSFLWTSVVNFLFYFIFQMEIMFANRVAPDGTPRFAALHVGLFCLHMSHKKDGSLYGLNGDPTIGIRIRISELLLIK